MIRYPRRYRLLAGALAALSGYVDAIGFLSAGGLFVSFMSGNSTRLAVDLATGSRAAGVAAMLIACFVAGATSGALIAGWAGARRKPAVLASVAALLALGAASQGVAAVAAMALAMGFANATFLRDGEVSIGVTYMTGTLVKLGHRLAGALRGEGARWAWVPYLLLWAGLMGGALTGALAFAVFGAAALWGAVAVAVVLATWAALLGPNV